MPRKGASFRRRATRGATRVGREGSNRLRATQPRTPFAVARLADALNAPTTDGAEAERRALFLRHLTDHGPATTADLHALTGLADGSRPGTTRLLDNLHTEGLVDRRRLPGGHGSPWLYRLADHGESP